jgi:hypothetical protein
MLVYVYADAIASAYACLISFDRMRRDRQTHLVLLGCHVGLVVIINLSNSTPGVLSLEVVVGTVLGAWLT